MAVFFCFLLFRYILRCGLFYPEILIWIAQFFFRCIECFRKKELAEQCKYSLVFNRWDNLGKGKGNGGGEEVVREIDD